MAELHDLTVAEAARLIQKRELSPVELLQTLLRRIDQLEPRLDAWVTIDRESALDAAHRSEEEIGRGQYRGPFHGIPVGVKDILYTEGLKTTSGSRIYADFVPEYDATAVAKLKEAGAIIVGKTVTTEFAMMDPPPTFSPWNPEHTPGGSSTGSAVVVATRMVPAALGSQGSASNLRPAAYNGIVGLKATTGRISLTGVFPHGFTNDHVGIMARTVEDAALMLSAVAGHDPSDPSSLRHPVPDYRAALETHKTPPRIGLLREYFFENAEPETRKHTEEAVQRLADAGAEFEDVKLPKSFATSHAAHNVLGRVGSAAIQEEMFRQRPNDFSPRIRGAVEVGMLIPGVRYVQALRLRTEFRRNIAEIASRYDALLTPATPGPAPRGRDSTGDMRFQIPWSYCGLPTIAVPSGLHPSQLPLGLQLITEPVAEAKLLAVARWCEKVLDVELVPPIATLVS